MKETLFLYNIIFLFFGNLLLSNIHHIHEHDNLIEHYECGDCLNLENNNNYILDFNGLVFLNYANRISAFPNLDFNDSNYTLKNSARAPPISK